MIDNSLGDGYLQHFDSLDLNQVHERRIGVFVLENFLGTVLFEVGPDVFNIREGDSMTNQWKNMRDSLETVDGLNVPSRFNKLVFRTKNKRNEVYHQFDKGADRQFLEETREVTPEWRDWIIRQSEVYYDIYGRYTRQEIEDTSEFVEDIISLGQHSRAVENIVNEVDYATRILLKSKGVHPQLRNKLERYVTHMEDVEFNRSRAKAYRRLRRMRGNLNSGHRVEERQARQLISDGIDLLRYIHALMSPFEEVETK